MPYAITFLTKNFIFFKLDSPRRLIVSPIAPQVKQLQTKYVRDQSNANITVPLVHEGDDRGQDFTLLLLLQGLVPVALAACSAHPFPLLHAGQHEQTLIQI